MFRPKRFGLVLIVLSFILSVSAQENSLSLKGVVRDLQGHPLSGVSVSAKPGGATATTNASGEFVLPVPPQARVQVRFTAEGYIAITQTIDTADIRELVVTLTKVPFLLQEVHVTAPRLETPLLENPAAVSSVDTRDLETAPRSVAAEEALISVPGLKVDNQANQERVHLSIRGQGILTERGIRGIGILLDGLPLNDPSGFAPDLFDVDWASVQELHVVRGPVAFLYGGGSSGGAIDISTWTPGENSHGRVELSGGSNTFYKAHGDYSGPIGPAKSYLSFARAEGDGYRVHTRFYGNNLYGKVGVKPHSNLELNFVGLYTGYFNQNPEGLNIAQVEEDPRLPNPDALKYNEYQKTKRGTGGMTGVWNIAESQRLAFNVFGRRTRFDESVPSSVQHRDYVSPGTSAQYSVDFKSGILTHHLSAGTDLDGQWIDDRRRPNLGNAVEGETLLSDQAIAQKRLGTFFTERLAIGLRWSLLGSIRWDQTSNHLDDRLKANGMNLSGQRTFQKATGRAGIAYNPRPQFGLYASWGQGFLPPATEELYANPDALGGFNNRLSPATSIGWEGGARGTLLDRLWYNVAVFHLDTENDFERYRVPKRPLETFYGNAGASSRNGLESEIRWLPTSRITLTGAYTYSHFKYTSYESQVYPGEIRGNWLPNSPNHQIYCSTSLQLPRSFYLGAGIQTFSRAFIDPTNSTYIDGYGLLSAHLSKQWQKDRTTFRLFVSGRNLASTNYIAFTEPDPDGNSYQPGPTREIFGGLEVRF